MQNESNEPHSEATDTPPSPPPASPNSSPSSEERQWAMFAHLSILVGGLISGAVGGWMAFLGPLVMWLIKKDTPGFAAEQSREALNFGIGISLVTILLVAFGTITLGIGFILSGPLLLIVGIVALIFIVIGAVKANDGIAYRYPINWRVVK